MIIKSFIIQTPIKFIVVFKIALTVVIVGIFEYLICIIIMIETVKFNLNEEINLRFNIVRNSI